MIIREREAIKEEDLAQLFRREIGAVRCPNYIDPVHCGQLAARFVSSRLFGAYINAEDIGRVGQAFFECQATSEARSRYEAEAVSWIREMRALCAPFQPPIDRVRAELDEVWSAGAQLGSFCGKKMFAGLSRRFGEGSEAEPHQDVFEWDTVWSGEPTTITSQIALNIYLTLPKAGGELALWSESLNRAEYDARKVPGSYGLRRSALSEPMVTLVPRAGELILINSMRIHAVEKITSGTRVTATCFVGYQGDKLPLIIWS